MSRRIILDCTHTFSSPLRTGIERVVRSLVAVARLLAAERDVEVEIVAFDRRHGFVPVVLEDSARKALNRPMRLRAALRLLALESPLRWAKRGLLRFVSAIHATRRSQSTRSVNFRPGDVLLLLDNAVDAHYWQDISQARLNGAHVGAILYDLIPLRHAWALDNISRHAWLRWWNAAQQQLDFLACISATVQQEANEVLVGHPRLSLSGACQAFPLGFEFPSGSEPSPVRTELTALFSDPSSAPFVCVGMVSPRKNRDVVLAAFDRLWAQGSEARLALVGEKGREVGRLEQQVRCHPQLGKRLFWFHGVQDRELEFIYRNARGLIAPSLLEGFDLPVVEALTRGCPVLASDIGVHREVAGNAARYFPPHSADVLASLVIQEMDTPTGPLEFAWYSWQESCRRLLQISEGWSIPAAKGPPKLVVAPMPGRTRAA